jgi:hypothetical protein
MNTASARAADTERYEAMRVFAVGVLGWYFRFTLRVSWDRAFMVFAALFAGKSFRCRNVVAALQRRKPERCCPPLLRRA